MEASESEGGKITEPDEGLRTDAASSIQHQ